MSSLTGSPSEGAVALLTLPTTEGWEPLTAVETLTSQQQASQRLTRRGPLRGTREERLLRLFLRVQGDRLAQGRWWW